MDLAFVGTNAYECGYVGKLALVPNEELCLRRCSVERMAGEWSSAFEGRFCARQADF